jgi:hypothetical protein
MKTEQASIGSNPLAVYAKNVTSQDGEDGIIEHIFSVIGATNRYCLELGALNGTHHSNTHTLIRDHGWSGLMIEAEEIYFNKLKALYADSPQVVCKNAFVSFEGENSLNVLCKDANLPQDFDLLVLDIDGADYHLWESLTEFKPRLVCIEFNQTIPNEVEFIQSRNMAINQGSSLRSIAKLAEQKGYALVGTTTCNAFFVQGQLFSKFGITDVSLDALHPDMTYQTQLYQLYDGTLCIAGYDRLFWQKVPINLGRLQVLPKRKRRYPAHIAPSSTMRQIKNWVRRSPLRRLVQMVRSW